MIKKLLEKLRPKYYVYLGQTNMPYVSRTKRTDVLIFTGTKKEAEDYSNRIWYPLARRKYC